MQNIPVVKPALVAVSRDCFPKELSERRRAVVAAAYGDIYECKITVENERDMLVALEDINKQGVNALVILLGNFGPETPETLLAKNFKGPSFFVAAAEEDSASLTDGRGDAYCGMLNCSYNLSLRNTKAFIPEYPVGTPKEIAKMIERFIPAARAVIGLNALKIITYGPRPQDFFACNAPIKPLYDLGVEIQENSELDLLAAFNARENDARIVSVVAEMQKELGDKGQAMRGILPRLAQYEITLCDLAEENKGASSFAAFANKCWPAFQTQFGFVPCYVNSRLTARGFPVACETDIYGALSEYIGLCVLNETGGVTLLDINNTVPQDMYEAHIKGKTAYTHTDTFMGFHCGNTPMCRLKDGELKYQRIMKRLLEPEGEPNITRGTLEGDLVSGSVTLYRLQARADGQLCSYIAQGETLDVKTESFGGIGVFAIPEMGRFYRHVLIQGRYPHHGAVAFGHIGTALYDVFTYLGVPVAYNRPARLPYDTENPF